MILGRRPTGDDGVFTLAPHHQLLYRAALADDERALDAYRTWSADLDLAGLDVASQRMIAPLVANLERLGVADDDPWMERFRKVTRFTWLKTQFLIGQTEPVLRALADAGIPAMALKGAAVVHHTGGAVALRPMDDIDLAVPFASLHPAVGVLTASGFVTEGPARTAGELAALARGLWSIGTVNGAGAEIDLHWHVLHGSLHPDADREFWAAAVPAHLGRTPCLATGREDTLLHVVAHAARPEADPTLRWAGDVVALVRSAGPDGVDWDRVVDQARRHRLALPTADALEVLRRVVGLPVPAGTVGDLRRTRVPLAERLESAPRRNPDGSRRIPTPTEQLVDAYQGFVRRRVRPGRRAGLADRAGFLAEWWDLPSVGHIPAHALFVALGRPWRTAGRMGAPTDSRSNATRSVAVGDQIGFAVGGDGHRLLGRGWSFPEPHGTWTIGREAAVRMMVDGPVPARLTFTCTVVPFLAPGRHGLGVDVVANGSPVARWRFEGEGWQPAERRVEVDPAVLPPSGRLELRFVIDRPLAPDAVGHESTQRPVGLSLHALRIGGLPTG
jgi:hypothetical protein